MCLASFWRKLGVVAGVVLALLSVVGAVVAGPDVALVPRPLSIPGNPTPWPVSDAVSVPATTTISMSYDEAMDPTTVSTQTFSVHAMQTGVLTGVYDTSGGNISLTPVQPLKSGELVQASATTQTLSLGGEAPVLPTVWQFRVATMRSTGVFSYTGQSLGSDGTYDLALGDVDGDGDLDLLTGNAEANKLWLNDGSGLFSDSGLVLGSERTNALALGDLDRDGDLDLFTGNGFAWSPAANEVWLNDGHGLFENSSQALGITGTVAIALADLDGDGDLDALAGNDTGYDYSCTPLPCPQGGGVEVWLNDGTGTYHEGGPRFSSETHTKDVAAVDVDGDGDLDVIVANYAQQLTSGLWYGGKSRVWLNDGSGVFSDSGQTLGEMKTSALDVGDVNGDGLPDVILGVSGSPDQVWLNDGLGGFVDSGQRLGNGTTADVALGDVDGDGDLDIVIVASDNAYVWVNDGGIQGGALGHFSDSGQVLAEGRLEVAGFGDLDGDGDLDFAGGYIGEPGPNRIWINNRFAPVAADDSLSVMPDAVNVVLNVLANDTDADGDVLDLIAAGEPDRGGTVVLSGTTHIRYSSATGYTGPEVFTYTVSDPGGLTDTAVVTVEVGGANDAPVPLDDSVSTLEDIALDIAVLVNDSDPNGQTLSIAGVSAPQDGIATIAGTDLHYEPFQDWHGRDVFAYSVSDGWLTATAHVTVTVAPVNDAPTLTAIPDLTLPEDAPLQRIALTGISSGALNEPQVLTVTADRVLSVIPVPTVIYTSPNAMGELVFQPVADEFGVAYVTVAISDGLTTTEREFQVTVESVNDAPSFVLPAPLVIDEDAGLQTVGVVAITFGPSNEIDQRPALTLTATSTDPAVVPHPAITYNNTAGSYSAATMRFTSPPDVYGGATLVVTLTDGISTTTQSLPVTVSPVNDPPSLDALGGMTFSEDGAAQSVALSGIDAGPNESQTLVVTARSTEPELLPHPTVAYSSPDAAGSLSVVPAADRYGTATVWVTVTDGLAETGRSFPVTIAPVNDGPTMSPIAGIHLDAGGAAQSVPITDIGAGPYESQPLTVTAVSHDSVLAALSPVDYISPATAGSVTVTPADSGYGVTTVDITVSDGLAETTRTFDVTVHPIFQVYDTAASWHSVSVTCTREIAGTTMSPASFSVHGSQSGMRMGSTTVASEPHDGFVFGLASFVPDRVFLPGERLMVSLTEEVQSTDGRFLPATTLQLRVPVSGGSGIFHQVDPYEVDMQVNMASLVTFFRPQSVLDSQAVALGDLDGDDDLDAFVARNGAGSTVWFNDGTGTLIASGQVMGAANSWSVALGDVDGDGDLDAFVGNYGGANAVWLNDSGGVFSDSSQRLGDADTYAVALGDVDSDGDLDAVTGTDLGQANGLWLNDGTGGFSDGGQTLGYYGTRGIALGDLDGDGDLDCLLGNAGNAPNQVWLNQSRQGADGVFVDSGQRLGLSDTFAVAVDDLDGDGDLDAFVGNMAGQPNEVWFNVGGIFIDSGQRLSSDATSSVALGDLDADGDLDAYVGNVRYGLVTEVPDSVWLNDGHGGFVSTGQVIGAWDSLSVGMGDIDSDGDLDVFAGTSNGVEQPNVVLRNWPTPPVARDVVVVVARDVAAEVDVLAGDLDLDGSVLSVGGVGEPLAGQAWTDGRLVTYVPLPGFTGQDVFTYTIRDVDDLEAVAEVHVSVVAETLTATVDATSGGVLLWANGQSHVTVAEVPPGAVTVTTELKLVPLAEYGSPVPPLAFAGPVVELIVSRDGVALPDFAFVAPVTLTVRTGEIYDADWDVATLGLRRWDGDVWTDTGLDPLGSGDRVDAPAVLPAYSVLTLSDGQFGLLGLSEPDLTHVYLPLVLSQSDGGVHEQ